MDPSELRMNLAALQRIDPYIKTILLSASQVALYRFINHEWSKTDAEGTLFVYERKCEPQFGFLILNRLSADNWVQPINMELDSQIQPPFLLYKNKDSEIYGIWFYEEDKCRSVGKAIEKYAKLAEEKSSSGRKPDSGKMDLTSLLNKAASSSSEKNQVSLKNTKESPSGGEKLLRLLKKGHHPPQAEKMNEEPPKGPSASSVMEFFAQASQQEQNLPPQPTGAGGDSGGLMGPPQPIVRPVIGPVPTGIVQIMQGVPPGMALLPQQPGAPPVLVPLMRPPHPPPNVMMPVVTSAIAHPDSHIPAMQSLLANPGAVSLESLERQHREESCTPPAATGPTLPKTRLSSQELESDLKSRLSINNFTPGSGKKKANPMKIQKKTSPSTSHQSSYAEALVSPPKPLKTMRTIDSTNVVEVEEPQLLSPMMFSQPTSIVKDSHLNGVNGSGSDFQDITPLTKTQLAQAMQHLLRTDPTFIGKLHQAYVESLNNKLN